MMRFPHRYFTLAYAALATLAGTAAAEPAPLSPYGAYWGIYGGQNDLDRLHVRVAYPSGTASTGHADLQHGSHVGVQIGRRGAHWRHELEFEAGDFRLRHLAVGPINADADARGHYQAAFANGYYTARLGDAIDAFAGAGIGWGRASLPHLKLKSACTCLRAASNSGAAWQLRAGLAYHVTPLSDLAIQYTRLRLPGPETAGPPAVQYERLGFGAWTLGWRSRF